MKNDLFADAVTDIREDFIAEARAAGEERKRSDRFVRFLPAVASVACVCLIVAGIIGRQVIDGNFSTAGSGSTESVTNEESSATASGMLGGTQTSAAGSVTFAAESLSSVTLFITKNTDDAWQIYFYGTRQGEEVVATTDGEYRGNTVENAFTLTVNGALSEECALPVAAGEYTVTIDLTQAAEEILFDRFSVAGFTFALRAAE